jgi:NTP pyrophosphatase (non-canonical NTP hydrolase)
MDLEDAVQRAREVRSRYALLEVARYGREWSTVDLMNGLVGDVGDLSKLVAAHSGVRQGPADLKGALEHELADCLWSLLVLADAVDVDIVSAFVSTMRSIDAYLDEQLADSETPSHE